jgi:hypothetical protein
MEQSFAVISAAEPTDHHAYHWPMAATISHSGAVHEFLMLPSLPIRPSELHGHAASTAGGGYLDRFPAQSPEYPPVEQLPRCSVCLRMKNKHLPISG